MFNFIISITWQVLVFWVATKIGFSMQVIDSATVFVKQTEICQYLQPCANHLSCTSGAIHQEVAQRSLAALALV